MGGLLPERHAPGKLAIFYHPFVATPGGIDQDIEPARVVRNSLKSKRCLSILGMIATQANNGRGKVCRCDASTRCKNGEVRGCQPECHASPYAARCARD